MDNSSMVEVIDIATSITAPSAAINIPQNRSSPTSIPICSCTYTKSSISDTLYPLISVILEKIHAKQPDMITPAIVPIEAHTAFLVAPATKYMVATVVRIITRIAAIIGECPL